MFVPSCCDKSETSCYHLVTRSMTVTDSLQVAPTRLIQAVCNMLLRACRHQLVNLLRADDIRLVGTTCCESVGLINLDTGQQFVPDLEQTMWTHLVIKLWHFCEAATGRKFMMKNHKFMIVKNLSSKVLSPRHMRLHFLGWTNRNKINVNKLISHCVPNNKLCSFNLTFLYYTMYLFIYIYIYFFEGLPRWLPPDGTECIE